LLEETQSNEQGAISSKLDKKWFGENSFAFSVQHFVWWFLFQPCISESGFFWDHLMCLTKLQTPIWSLLIDERCWGQNENCEVCKKERL